MTKQIPNIFTLLNLFLGCIAIVFALQTESFIIEAGGDVTSFNIPEKLSLASYFIFAAAVIDFLDGFVARLLNATSEIGKQLDSLSDVVSFGVAPAIIIYQLLRISFIKDEGGMDTSLVWLLPAFIIACAGAYRLARFNIDTEQSYGFKGVPIPAAGLLIASFPLILHYGNNIINVSDWLTNKWVLYVIILIVSWLMVSKLPLMALKFKDFSVKNNLPKYILAALAIIAAILLKWLAVPVVFVAYIILSLLYKQK
jgi:CDP-diacylglycerol---serine O-phosphatidyltransferase